jgi:hypothetical protein
MCQESLTGPLPELPARGSRAATTRLGDDAAVMIRPTELRAIRDGEIDLAFRRWERPRVVVGTRMRTAIGLVEVTSLQQVQVDDLTEDDARRAGAPSLATLLSALEQKADRPAWRVGLRHAGEDPRAVLRQAVPDRTEVSAIVARLERLDRASSYGAWTRETLDLIDRNPERRAPDLAMKAGRETAEFKRDVRKLKELGLTESLAIGYRLSPRGEVVVDRLRGRRRRRPPRPGGTALPRSIGAPATRALREAGLTSLETLGAVTEAQVAAMHGVGPIALARLREALADAELGYAASSPDSSASLPIPGPAGPLTNR